MSTCRNHRMAAPPAFLICFLVITLGLAAQDIPAGAWAGVWVFDPVRSKFPGPAPQADRVVIQPDGTVSVQETSAEGKTRAWSYKPREGKTVPVEGHGENVTVLVRKVNELRLEQTWDYNGKPGHSYATLSKDGKTQIFHVIRADKNGKPFEEIIVFIKQ